MLDKAGYVMVNNEYGNDYHTLFNQYNASSWEMHLTVVEPRIGSVLIKEGILQKINCTDVESSLVYQTYTVSFVFSLEVVKFKLTKDLQSVFCCIS